MRKFLFICYEHQYIHFLKWHMDAINSTSTTRAVVLLCDKELSLSRSGWRDILKGINLLKKYLISNDFDMIISITPKAGFLISIINFFFQIKHIHWFTGQVWANDKSIKRFIKKIPDLIIANFATKILCDSDPQKLFLMKNGFYKHKQKISVPGSGSICGIDDNIFKNTYRHFLKTEDTITRIGIVGRINEDKGILWLLESIKFIPNNQNFIFVFFGTIDGKDEFKRIFLDSVNSHEFLEYHGESNDKEKIYNSFDVLLCCSYREGFSNTIIEAQAFFKPIIVRNIYGVQSSYIDGKSGLSFSNNNEFHEALLRFSNNLDRIKFGKNGHKFVEENFRRSRVINNCLEAYGCSSENLT